MAYKKVIELFLANESVDSLTIAEMSNWAGKAIKIPRIEVNECKRDDVENPGVYFLFCKDEEGQDAVYIGESENVKQRLLQHISDYNADKESYQWNTAIIVLGNDLDKAVIRYLEKKYVEIAKECKRYKVLTQKTYSTSLKESKRSVLEEFIDNSKILISALGYKVFEPIVKEGDGLKNEKDLLFLQRGKIDAKGMQTTEGFVLFKGSKIFEKTAPSLSDSSKRIRNKYIESGTVEECITKEDILFNSSSQAADFVTGCSSSGPKLWKNKDGVELREIEKSNN